nr:hypothetical protein [uncultured Mediterraneibacter sp.]
MKRKVVATLLAGAMAASMAMPTTVFAETDSTSVGYTHKGTIDPNSNLMVVVPADVWLTSADEVIDNFDVDAYVYDADAQRYIPVTADGTDMGSGVTIPVSAASNNTTQRWSMAEQDPTGTAKQLAYEYKYNGTVGTASPTTVASGTSVSLGNLSDANPSIEGTIGLSEAAQKSLTTADRAKNFKDTIVYTFTFPNSSN